MANVIIMEVKRSVYRDTENGHIFVSKSKIIYILHALIK